MVYYLDDEDEFKLRTKRISLIEVPYYKAQIRRKRNAVCLECGNAYLVYSRNDKEILKTECPNCDDSDVTLVPAPLPDEIIRFLE